MAAKRIHAWNEVHTVAARAVSSGHLHEAPDGRVGVYLGSQDVASGEPLTLHMAECLEVDVTTPLASAAANAVVNFNFTTQLVVASGGTNIGRYLEAKATDAPTGRVILNAVGARVS